MPSTSKKIKQMVESHFWPETIEAMISYERQHDDTDGADDGKIQVTTDNQGDAYPSIDGSKWLRFRTWSGGGRSLRTRTALLILAEAIRLDNEDK